MNGARPVQTNIRAPEWKWRLSKKARIERVTRGEGNWNAGNYNSAYPRGQNIPRMHECNGQQELKHAVEEGLIQRLKGLYIVQAWYPLVDGIETPGRFCQSQ